MLFVGSWYFGMFTAEGNVLMLFSTFHGDDYLWNKKKGDSYIYFMTSSQF